MEKAAACEPRRGRAMLASVAIDGAAGQDVMMNQTGQERPPVLRAARERTRAEGAGEIDAAAAFGTYAGNSSPPARSTVAAGATITTRHGPQLLAQAAGVRAPRPGRLVVPGPRNTSELDPGSPRAAGHGPGIELPHAGQTDGEFSLDPLLGDLAAHAGKATARSTATNTGYPSAPRQLAWQPVAMAARHRVRPHHRGGHRSSAPPCRRRKEAPAMTTTPHPRLPRNGRSRYVYRFCGDWHSAPSRPHRRSPSGGSTRQPSRLSC